MKSFETQKTLIWLFEKSESENVWFFIRFVPSSFHSFLSFDLSRAFFFQWMLPDNLNAIDGFVGGEKRLNGVRSLFFRKPSTIFFDGIFPSSVTLFTPRRVCSKGGVQQTNQIIYRANWTRGRIDSLFTYLFFLLKCIETN